MVENTKICSKCNIVKNLCDFYMSSERYRSECKACTIKITSKYQKDNESWKKRYSDPEEKKAASRAYYAKHKERFKRYR